MRHRRASLSHHDDARGAAETGGLDPTPLQSCQYRRYALTGKEHENEAERLFPRYIYLRRFQNPQAALHQAAPPDAMGGMA